MVAQNQFVTDSSQGSAEISSLVQSQRSFFASGQTRSIDFRLEKLKLLKSAILQSQAQIVQIVADIHFEFLLNSNKGTIVIDSV